MEIEAKFAIPNAKIFRQLLKTDRLADYVVIDDRIEEVRDTYLDTADRAILAAGLVLRSRAQDQNILITLKELKTQQADAIHRREEWEVTLNEFQPPDQWSDSPARDRVLQLIGDRPLAPLVELLQTRTLRQIVKDQNYVAEAYLDRVRVTAGSAKLDFRELECELLSPGKEEDLSAIVSYLTTEWNLQFEPRSKFERALEFVSTAANAQSSAATRRRARKSPANKLDRVGLSLDDPMAEAARKTLWFHFQQMQAHETGTRKGTDIEQLHDMRVATRRMRAALQVFAGYLDQAAYKPFAKALRRTARVLGAVRDLDVFHEKAQAYLDQLPIERRAELADLFQVWQLERDRARNTLLTYLDSDEYFQFKENFGKFLQTPEAGAAPIFTADGEPRPYRVRHVLPRILFEGLGQVRAYTEWLTESDLERYHQLRIASKELRYTLEFFREILASDAQTLITAVKQLQDHLGNLNDAVVACEILHNFLTWGVWQPTKAQRKQAVAQSPASPGAARYLTARQTEIQTLIISFAPVWSALTSDNFVQKIAGLITDFSAR
ncbi:MAG TPA: CHAD domain-containing protein [Anaerolineae bacterium]|nr:CHAD domain-containing protein [Anaerolineae bacterium]